MNGYKEKAVEHLMRQLKRRKLTHLKVQQENPKKQKQLPLHLLKDKINGEDKPSADAHKE